MSFIGNLFLVLSLLVYLALNFTDLGKQPSRGGDALMGYALGNVLVYLVLLACLTVATIAIAWKGGFEWISPHQPTRFLLVASGLLLAVLTAGLSALYRYENGPVPGLLRAISGFAPVLIPLVLIAAGFVLQNAGLRASVPVAAYRWPLLGVYVLSVLGVGSALYGWVSEANANAARRIEGQRADEAQYQQNHLNDIDSCDVTQHITRILVFTDANHDAIVRERAVAKVKSHPQWQQELVYWLENKGALEVFTFLASNEVEDKKLFAPAIHTGVLSVAEWIKRSIRNASHPSHLYADQFVWDVDRMLRSVDKFEGLGQDYRPDVRAVRAALDTPAEHEKPRFTAIAVLDAWLKKHP
ncbi:MAG: hypothetical protein IT260_16990 [Saprospiraceae bacterium]|nr:hypothetical protein [Saprospiraceae bacterium]